MTRGRHRPRLRDRLHHASDTWAGLIGIGVMLVLTATPAGATPPGAIDDTTTARQHANQAFERLDQAIRNSLALQAVKNAPAAPAPRSTNYPPDQYVIGTGHGDLSKGRLTCQRVAELAARSELAKQIRVLVKEHAIDRTRERSGHNTEQDLEVTREEIVQEYLQGVKIVDRQIDEATGLCSSTAVMPRAPLAPQAPAPPQEPSPVATH